MYELRLQCLDPRGFPLTKMQVRIFTANGISAPALFDTFNLPTSNLFTTDAWGYLIFRIQGLETLTFRTTRNNALGPLLPLYSAGPSTPPPPVVQEAYPAIAETQVLAGRGVRFTDAGGVSQARADTLGDLNKLVGVSRQNANPGSPLSILSSGYYTDSGLSLTLGAVFLGLGGDLVQAPLPSGLRYIQQLGVAVSSDTVMLTISPAILRG